MSRPDTATDQNSAPGEGEVGLHGRSFPLGPDPLDAEPGQAEAASVVVQPDVGRLSQRTVVRRPGQEQLLFRRQAAGHID